MLAKFFYLGYQSPFNFLIKQYINFLLVACLFGPPSGVHADVQKIALVQKIAYI